MRQNRGAQYDPLLQTLWEACARMKFDAATLAADDLPDLDKLPAAARAMIVCANVTHQGGEKNGAPIAPAVAYKTLTPADGRHIVVAIIGILGDPPNQTIVPNPANSPSDKPWHVESPASALSRVVPEARSKAAVVVVLYAGQRQTARKLQSDIPGIDVMIVGLEGQSGTSEMAGKGIIVQNADFGRTAGQLGITLDKDLHTQSFDYRSTTIDASFPDEPNMQAFVKAYQDERNKITPTNSPQPVEKSAWSGSYMCASCHAAEFIQWKSTKHFEAMTNLDAKDSGAPATRGECVMCHVTGYGQPGGYTLADPRYDLKGVGCESCHGAAAVHVDARVHGKPDTSRLIASPDRSLCVTCHNRDNSPDFDYQTYRRQIVHKPAAKTE